MAVTNTKRNCRKSHIYLYLATYIIGDTHSHATRTDLQQLYTIAHRALGPPVDCRLVGAHCGCRRLLAGRQDAVEETSEDWRHPFGSLDEFNIAKEKSDIVSGVV